jgi:hypothetical protein
MFDVYQNKRREPRVRLHTRVTLSGRDTNGEKFLCETVTVDVSPHGASLAVDHPLSQGEIVDFATRDYSFHTRAVVRSVERDRTTGTTVVGVEYLDDARNPVVIWKQN